MLHFKVLSDYDCCTKNGDLLCLLIGYNSFDISVTWLIYCVLVIHKKNLRFLLRSFAATLQAELLRYQSQPIVIFRPNTHALDLVVLRRVKQTSFPLQATRKTCWATFVGFNRSTRR